MSSILTNNGAMVALQTMRMINKDLGSVQDMISTGKRVANAKDNAAIWAISTVMESDVSSLKAVGDSLALGQSTVSVARNASEQVTGILEEMKAKIVSAQEENVDRTKIQADISALRDQIKSVVGAAQFNGLNLLKGTSSVNILASLDRSSNGTVATSNITVSRNDLDSGTTATSGTTDVISGTAVGTATFAGSVSSKDLAQFTQGTTTLTLAGSTGLDVADNATLVFDLDGGSAGNNVLTLTYSGATGTASEIATAYENAFDAWQADSTVTTTGNVAITITAESSAGNVHNVAQNFSIANASDGSVLTVTDNRERATAMDYTFSFNDVAASTLDVDDNAIAANASEVITLSGANLGNGDTYSFALTRDDGASESGTDQTITFVYTADAATAETATLVASELENAYSAWLADAGNGNITSYTTASGATIAITHNNSDAASFAAFDGVSITDGGGGALTINNTNAVTNIDNNAIAIVESVTSTRTTNNLNVTEGDNSTINTGTVDATDGSIVTTIAGTPTVGEKYAVTIEGLSSPVEYTVQTGDTTTTIATGLSAAANSALQAASLDGEFEATTSTNTVTFTNYSATANREVSNLLVSVPDADAAQVLDATNTATTTIAASGTSTFSFAGRTISSGDTYSLAFGSTSVSYVATANDNLNEVVTNLAGLAKIATTEDVSFALTTATDPESSTSAVTIAVTNNTTTAITSASSSAYSGGTAGGGLNLIDNINVTTNLKAEGSLNLIDNLIQNAIDASADFGSSEKRLDIQKEFISKLTDSLTAGIGTLVDANMEEAAARLQALQVQQQLGTQALSIANQSPQNILALFR